MSAGRFLSLIFTAVGLVSPILLSANFPNNLNSDSVNPAKDSAAFAAMRLKMDEIRKDRPTVALVLSGGGAKGAAEIGVMRYLEEKGIPVDMVVGTSMGSLIGGLYSVGYTAAGIDSIISSLDWSVIMSDNPARHSELKPVFSSAQSDGYLFGDNIYSLLSTLTAGYQDSISFKDLPIPFFCVATDILTTKSVNWCEGDLLDAMRSSMTLPVVFKPLRRGEMVLLDGGMRNNFPVDIARAMGADIIIGVDVGARTTKESLENMAGIVVESLSSMGQDAYRANRKAVDVFIRPHLEPYGTMSWESDAIDSLIQRGYAASLAVAPQLDSVLALTGKCERNLAGKPSSDLRGKSVAVRKVTVKGLSAKETGYFNSICHIRCGKPVPLSQIEKTVSDLYWTGSFKFVTYRLLGKEEPYELVFICEKASDNQLTLGLRIDTEEAVGLLAKASFFNSRFNGSHLEFNLKASMNPYVEGIYTYRTISGPDFGASSKVRYFSIYGANLWYTDSRIFIQNPIRRIAFWRVGGRFQTSPGKFSAFAEGGCDTRDDKYFPTKGILAKGRYEYMFGRFPENIHLGSIDLTGAISCSKVFAIVPSLYARMMSGNNGLPYYMENYVGGALQGRYFEQQMPMLSHPGLLEDPVPLITVAALSLRFNLFKNFYLDGNAEIYTPWFVKKSICGFALRTSYRILSGPISANLHWNSDTHSVGAYLSLGFDF